MALLVGVADLQEQCLLERPAADLQRQRQPVGVKPIGTTSAGLPTASQYGV